MKIMKFLLLLLTLAIGSCGGGLEISSTSGGTYAESTISKAGGQIETAAGDVILGFSANAIGTPTRVSIAKNIASAEENVIGGVVLDLKPDGLKFEAPVSLSIAFDKNWLSEDWSTAGLSLGYKAGNQWVPVPTQLNTSGSHLVSSIPHFSTWSVIYLLPDDTSPIYLWEKNTTSANNPNGSHCLRTKGTIEGSIDFNTYNTNLDRLGQALFGLSAPPSLGNGGNGCITNPYLGNSYSKLFPGMQNHAGLDFKAPIGTEVRSVSDGTIVFQALANDRSTLTIRSVIDEVSYNIIYLHCKSHNHIRNQEYLGNLSDSRYRESIQNKILIGDQICQSGDIGAKNNPHLHIELKKVGADLGNLQAMSRSRGVCPPLTFPGYSSKTMAFDLETKGCTLEAIKSETVDPAVVLANISRPACTSPQVLQGGVCLTPAPTCVSPQVLQSGVCVTPTPTCVLPQILQNGVCVTPTPTCVSPQVLQNGSCVIPAPTCVSPQVLQNGICVTPTPTCVSPQVLQGGICVTPTPTCVSPQVLQGGICVTPTPTCVSPQVLQGGVCVTPTPTCVSPQVLQGGVCVTPTPTCISPQVLQANVCVVPVPSVSSIAPTGMVANSTAQTLTINGGNFSSASQIQYKYGVGTGANVWTSAQGAATFMSTSQLLFNLNPGRDTDSISIRVCRSATATTDTDCSSGIYAVTVTAVPTCISPQVLSGNACITPGLATSLVDTFDGSTLDATKWTYFPNSTVYANSYSMASGELTFSKSNADTSGKVLFSGSKIIIEARVAGKGGLRDTYVTLVDASNSNELIQGGDTNYSGFGLYIIASGKYGNSATATTNGRSFSAYKVIRLTVDGTQVTLERGDTANTLTERVQRTLTTSITGKTFYLRIGTGAPDYTPGSFDSISVTSQP